LAALLKDKDSGLATLTEDGELKFNHIKVWDFLHKCDAVNEKLAMLTFFTVGQTSRITDLWNTSMQIQHDHEHYSMTKRHSGLQYVDSRVRTL